MARKRALCQGVNDFPGTGNDLRGCVNDALNVGGLARTKAYEVETMTDRQVTKAATLGWLEEVLSTSRRGDSVLWWLSTHGAYGKDRAPFDEADGRDECVVMGDGTLLWDDEIHATLERCRQAGTRVWVGLDACHSGSATRAFAPDVDGRLARFMPPTFVMDGAEARRAREAEKLPPRGRSRVTAGAVLLSGCTDAEVSYDAHIAGQSQGAMSYAARRALEEDATLSARRWREATQVVLDGLGYPQHPQLTATWAQARVRALR